MSLTAKISAQKIVDAIESQSESKQKRISRFQLSTLSISRICKRRVMPTVYLDNLSAELNELGWCMFQVENTKYGFVRASSVKNWLKMSSKTVNGIEGE